MREIKFRGKKAEKGDWVIGHYASDEIDNAVYIECLRTQETYRVLRKTVGQFTELKDKNGIEIFAGDIIKSSIDHIYLIIYENGGYKAKDVFNNNSQIHETFMKLSEVIGNIYDHPKLFK